MCLGRAGRTQPCSVPGRRLRGAVTARAAEAGVFLRPAEGRTAEEGADGAAPMETGVGPAAGWTARGRGSTVGNRLEGAAGAWDAPGLPLRPASFTKCAGFHLFKRPL